MELSPSEVQSEETHISDNDSATVITVVATCFFVAFIAVTLRLISRRLKHLYLQQDDYGAIIALAFAAGLSANVGIDLYAGLGKHTILSNHTSTFAKSITATQILYITALIPTKLSIIFFYRRLSTSGPLSVSLWLLGIWVVVTGIAGDLMAIFNCAEAPTVKVSAHCVDYRAAVFFHGGQDVLTNLVLLCWPLQLLWGLEISRIMKVHLAGVFALGGFACAASIVRLIYLANASLIDSTWSATTPTIWSVIELTIGLTAGCLTTLTPLMSLILPQYSSSPPLTIARRTRSFMSDTETAVATPQTSSRKRARTISFKDPPTPSNKNPNSNPSPKAKRKSKTKTGADSPGFTWRCSGRPSDLERWKALPLPPPPEEAHVLTPLSPRAVEVDAEEGDGEAVFGPDPLFRPVNYGGRI